MIKIQEHLNIPNPVIYLDNMAENLWWELNPMLKSKKGFKQSALIKKCEHYSRQTGNTNYRRLYASNDIAIANRHKAFFDYLSGNAGVNLKNIIKGKPDELLTIRGHLLTILRQDDLYTGTPNNYSQTKFGKLLSEQIFNYKKFRGSDFCKKLFWDLNFDSAYCPYCNDNKLVIIKLRSNSSQETKLKAYMDLDHFYPKSLNPFFAISFYNLIPTCHACNASEKGDKPFELGTQIHPYYESFDDYYEFTVPASALSSSVIDKISLVNNGKKPLDRTVGDLRLEERYQSNLKDARRLIKYYLDYRTDIGTEREQAFIDALFDLHNVPKIKSSILQSERGKMKRDIVKYLDVHKVLGII